MKSLDQSYDRFNLIGTILYLFKIDSLLVVYHLTYLTFSVNFSNQLFELTYIINLFNELIIPLTCSISFSQTDVYTYKGILLPTNLYIIQIVNFHVNYSLIKLWDISLLTTH